MGFLVEKRTCASHIFKGHMSVLYMDCTKFPTNRFVGNLCSLIIGSIFINIYIHTKVQGWLRFQRQNCGIKMWHITFFSSFFSFSFLFFCCNTAFITIYYLTN